MVCVCLCVCVCVWVSVCVHVFVCVSGDMIYEDVQREGSLQGPNGWSSSEFESYDEQSDPESRAPARSKVPFSLSLPLSLLSHSFCLYVCE